MYLKSLEISGFKSFAKKSELHFNVPISAVVGPNGSGKSNIAEAFRFVLGEQSIKSLRGKRGEDLIFNGSGDSARGNRAAVKIIFDNSRRFLNVDFDEVSVERIVYRDGVNEYLINGSVVRLRDVIELLSVAHIGPSGHHIISQGEADRVLNSNPKERKSMIEEALGLKIYQYKRQESERKLEKTEENIKSVESLRREILPHLKFLKKQVEKVEQAIEQKSQLALLYKEYFKREKIFLDSERVRIDYEKKPALDELRRLEKEFAAAKTILESSKTFDAKSKEIIALEENLRAIRTERDARARELGQVEGELSAEKRLQAKQKEMAEASETQTVPLSELKKITEQIESATTSAANENDINALRKIISTVREMFKKFVVEHSRSSAGVASENDSKEIIEKLLARKAELERISAALSADEVKISAKYSALQDEIEKEKDSNREAEKKVFEIHAKKNQLTAELATFSAREETLKIETEDFKRELGEAGALIGREVLDYENFEIAVGEGVASAAESRAAQADRRRAIEKIKIRLEDSGLGSSDEILKEYREVSERDTFLMREIEDLEKSSESLKKLIDELEEKIETEFKEGIEKINKQFQNFFTLMFGGGSASLDVSRPVKHKKRDTDLSSLLDGENLESGGVASASVMGEMEGDEAEDIGIDISVSLPKKKVKGLMMLSGGERALTSIALIFAMSQVKPPPFIILDETDAALDEANSRKYGDMIENLSKLSQLILITHNRETMSRAGVLYGVTMATGISKLLSIKFDEAVSVAK
ncbi:MAG: AAA family ATPase [Patescibacteria group bacterium]